MHQRKESVATDGNGRKTSTLPEEGHAKKRVGEERRDDTDECTANKRSCLVEGCENCPVPPRPREVPEHDDPSERASESETPVGRADLQIVPEQGVHTADDLADVGSDRNNAPDIEEFHFVFQAHLVPVGLVQHPSLSCQVAATDQVLSILILTRCMQRVTSLDLRIDGSNRTEAPLEDPVLCLGVPLIEFGDQGLPLDESTASSSRIVIDAVAPI